MHLRNSIATFAVALVCLAPAVKADGNQNAPTNVVYVHSNDPGGDSVIAFKRDPNTGALSKLHGSPFLTGGKGFANSAEVLGPDDNDQEMVATADRRFLYVTDQGSNTIAGFAIQSDGSLKAVPGSPFPSGGVQPASLGIDGYLLIAMNRGDQNPGGGGGSHAPTYTSFLILPEGSLIQIPAPQPALGAGSSPTQALISPDGKLMFDAHLFANPFDNTGLPPFIPAFSTEMHSYKINPFGQLTPAAQTAPPAPIPPFVLGLQVHPTQKILYAGLVVASALGTYSYDDNGNMTFVGATPGAPNGGLCWIAISPDSKYLYTSDAITDQIDVYSIAADPLHPLLVQTVDLAGIRSPANFLLTATFYDTTPFQLHTSPDGKFLFVVNHEVSDATGNNLITGNTLHVLARGSGDTLTEVPGSPWYLSAQGVQGTTHPLGVVVF